MDAQPNIIETVRNFALEIKNKGIKLNKIYLYGSYAKNMQLPHSDIDVALISDDFIGVGFVDIKKFISVLRNYILIQPRTYYTKDFDKGDPFIEEIKKTGREIVI
ncbi:MAG: hypothetical protein A2X08_00250 [Bacteroidetes bacterium GWA2_32_17]|nr:MAG: hypothetical protein A2X08_00250 [Bacteroidetes bacterium GWA2_32_17]